MSPKPKLSSGTEVLFAGTEGVLLIVSRYVAAEMQMQAVITAVIMG
jgi:hypothetical protein